MISKEDIDKVEDFGTLHGRKVKIVRSKGGFNIAVGIKKGSTKEEVLAAGSHPAIVRHAMEQQHPEFQPMLAKNAALGAQEIVMKHTKHLPEDLKKSGHDIYSIEKDGLVEFQVTKFNTKIGHASGDINSNSMNINEIKAPKEFTKALSAAVAEKAVANKVLARVKVE